jgi:hypothetical protein
MGSPSDYSSGTEADQTSDAPVSDGDEPETNRDDDSGELREQTAAMLRKLADTYGTEAEAAKAQAERLRAEAKEADAKATQLAEEAARVSAEAQRLSNPPSWQSDDAQATASTEPAPSGPEPARGYAGSQPSAPPAPAETTTTGTEASHPSVLPGSPTMTAATESDPKPKTEQDDWAPRPFESWRNQAGGQTSSRFGEL